jgi:predicted transcriptional regulator
MKSNGRDLLLYIIYNIKENEDFINLKLDKICGQIKTSRPSLIKGINELSDVGIITRKSQSNYWVNPHFIFKGNRIEHYYKCCPESVSIISETNKKQ